MEIFTANQVNQVYVANAYKGSKLTKDDKVGTITIGKNSVENAIYVQQIGAGGLTRSDLIDVKKILYGKATKASDMARKLKVATIKLDTKVNGGEPLAGQDYILRLAFTHVISISPENQYWKYGAVHAYKDMTVSDFYKTMALSIARNMSREAVKMVAIYLGETEVTPETKESDLTGTYNSVVIKEVEQDWILGIKQQKPVVFTAEPTIINIDGEEQIWGTVEYSDGDTVGNGKKMADYEYFYMGERGDQYRMVGWPNYIPTTYLVDPNKEYDTIAIHFAYTGDNHAVQMSEKDITILVPTDASITDTIISAINTAAGTTVIEPLD